MILSITWNIIKAIVMFLKYPFYAILIVLAIFTFLISINICIGFAQGKRFKKGQHNIVKKKSFLEEFSLTFQLNLLMIYLKKTLNFLDIKV